MGLLDLFRRLSANDSGMGALLDRLKPGYFNETAAPFANNVDRIQAGVRNNPYREEALKDIYAPQHGQPLGSANTNFNPAQAEIEQVIAAMDAQKPPAERAADRWGVDPRQAELEPQAAAIGEPDFPRDPFLYGEVSPDDLYPQSMDAAQAGPELTGVDLIQNLLRMQEEAAPQGLRPVAGNPLAPGLDRIPGLPARQQAAMRWGVENPMAKALLLGLGGGGAAAYAGSQRPA